MDHNVLLVSAGIVHPSLLCRFWLRRALAALPGYRYRRIASVEALPGLPLDAFRAVVLYLHHDTISPLAFECLESFVRSGSGVLAIHSASASFTGEEAYLQLLGGRFVEHGPVEPFEVRPAGLPGDLFAGIPPFSVEDELYRHEYDPGNRIHLYTPLGDEQEPVVWTRSHGAGRVCYCALGHTASSMRHPQVRQILQRGLDWVSGGPLAEEAAA
jgi:type 1 glutamine amidotransferase